MAEVTAQYILETLDREIGESFCDNCFRKLSEDDDECEYGLEHPADDRCPKHRAYLDLVESADELAGKIMNGGREI